LLYFRLAMRIFPRSSVVFAALVAAACSGADPGGGNSGGDGTPQTGGATTTNGGTGGSGSGGASSSSKDAGRPAVNDPVVPGTLVQNPQDAFTGAPAFVSNPPTIRANDQHDQPVTGKPCLACHDGVTCTKFDFAGTVWKAPAKTVGAADVEVRIIDADSYAHSVHSDADGNFWHRANTDLPMPALSGVRTASFHAIGKLNGTSCNECHQPTNVPPGRLYVQ
jgi:hypothetical protein